MNKYEEMRQRHQAEANALPIHWAFTEEQFNEELKKMGLKRSDKGKLCRVFDGFCLVSDAKMIADTLIRHHEEEKAAIEADTTGDGFIKDMFLYELRNHEYTYTLETDETVEACGFTPEKVEADERLKHGLEAACKQLREAAGFSF